MTGLSLSSARVSPGDLYAALPGARAHGATYAADAVAAGAVAVLTDAAGAALLDEEGTVPGVPVLVLEDPRSVLGDLAARLYGEPARGLTLMAVTGTQGKTTTTRLLEGGLSTAGERAAVIGTVGTRIAGQDVKTSLTTPEAPDLHALFAVMLEQGVTACAMEVSSHALVMGRVAGVTFDVAGFLNLGRDHLDFHDDVEDYFAAKASLFTPQRTRRGLTNVDDEHGRRLLEIATVPMVTFSPSGGAADWRAVEVTLEPEGSSFTVVTPTGEKIAGRVPLTGSFNVANALCAIALAGEAGLDPAQVADGIARGGGVPGRLERVDAGQGFLAVVDYAHKPDAVEAALAALRPLTPGRLVLVIGAGGDRDTGKRPVMGEIGARSGRRAAGHRRQPAQRGPCRDPRCGPRRGRRGEGRGRGARGRRPAYGDPGGCGDGRPRGHRGDRRQGPRDRAGDRRDRAPLRRPGRAARGAGGAQVIALTLAQLAEVVGGTVVDADPALAVTGPAFLDSRNPEAGGLFVAFEGEHVDGHDYAAGAVAGGAAAVLGTRPTGVPTVLVTDARAALQQLASYVLRNLRSDGAGPSVLAITGSQGKTTAKDMLARVLADAAPTVATAGLVQQRARTPAHRAPGRRRDPPPRAGDGRPRCRASQRAVRDRTSRHLARAQRGQGPHRRVRLPGADRAGEGGARRGPRHRRDRGAQR